MGIKVTLIEQLAPAAIDVPQLLVWAKLVVRAPEMKIFVMLSAEVPRLVMVTFCGALVDPTVKLPEHSRVIIVASDGT